MRNGNWCSCTNINTEKHQRLNGNIVSILCKKGENNCVNSLLFEARAIYLQLCDHQDNESE